MSIMGMLVEKPLLEGRTRLVQVRGQQFLLLFLFLLQEGGKRHKIVTRDGNEIDTMFVQQGARWVRG